MRKKVFTTKDTKSTKFGVLIIRTLRVLRDLRGEVNFFIDRELLTAGPKLHYARGYTQH